MKRGAAVLPAGGRSSIAPRRSGRHGRFAQGRKPRRRADAVPFQKPTGLADGLEHESALGWNFLHPYAPAADVPTGRIWVPRTTPTGMVSAVTYD